MGIRVGGRERGSQLTNLEEFFVKISAKAI